VSVRPVHVIIAILVLVLAVGILVLRDRETPQEIKPAGAVHEDLGPGVQSVVLAYADREGLGMAEERREIAVPEDPAGRAKRILEELASGPKGRDLVNTIPKGTKVLSVVFDDAGCAFVDFSREIVANHPGGSTGELLTIRSIVRTLSANFPDIASVQVLVEGKEVESIAGHIDASTPFPVDQYR
jgi:germination protein M